MKEKNPSNVFCAVVFLSGRVALLAVLCLFVRSGLAQTLFGLSDQQFQLSGTVELDEPDSQFRAHLARLSEYLANEQWAEAVDTAQRAIASVDGQVARLNDAVYISLRDSCHRQVASFPPPALALYRSRVDALAQQWVAEGRERRDPAPLRRVVDELFCSSHGDDALWTLGQMALEKGHYGEARRSWQQISASLPDQQPVGLLYPDTDLPLADVRARLVLVSILEGATRRATLEWELLRRLHPKAEGRLGGRTGNYVTALRRLMTSSKTWPPIAPSTEWPTFAGSSARTAPTASFGAVEGRAWSRHLVLHDPPSADMPVARRRIAEDVDRLLSFYPIVVEDLLLLCNQTHLFAYDLHKGTPAWGQNNGVIFRPKNPTEPRSESQLVRGRLGVSRFTMTMHDGKLYARMGNPITAHRSGAKRTRPGGYLLCLDLKRQGAKVWEVTPEDDQWAFEGSPVCDGDGLYVGMRKSDVNPEAHVACLDAQTGRLRWRRKICAAGTPARGQVDEITHNLLTLAEDTLYYNTNLGAVAALSTHDGAVRWINLYQRAPSVDLSRRAAHFYRDLTPCVYHQGTVYVAPSDSQQLFALDATTGRRLWASTLPTDVVHLLGVGGSHLLASGDHLWWIEAATGKVVRRWPDMEDAARGFGRGMIAGDEIYWPTRNAIHVFSCTTTEPTQQPIRLTPRGAGGGNLLLVNGYLLIAASDTLYGFVSSK